MKAEEKKLWQLYKQTKRRELLEKIVEKYLYIVHVHASKLSIFTSHSIERDDLYSAGVMGLLEAVERFDPEQNVEFKTYAPKRIRGSIIDEIRKIDWVPRSVRMKSKKIDSAIHVLFGELGRIPSDHEIAAKLEMTIEEYYHITDNLGPMFLASLDAQLGQANGEDKLHLDDVIKDNSIEDVELSIMKQNLRDRIVDSIGQLPDKEKLVISLYYYEELNLKEIGMVLDVTESRVCQIHASALMKLRHMLQNSKLQTLI